MKRLSFGLVIMGLLCCLTTPAVAELRIGIGVPRVNIRIALPAFPEFVVIPGLPVYYAPRLDANYFFYDGYYWAYIDDNWYASDWYNGPWWWVDPFDVPLFILRIPIRYYRVPPVYFYDWPSHQPPRWGQRWGHDWERRHHDWDRWDRNRMPPAAPLPTYQRDYAGKRYPHRDRQEQLHREHYLYKPHERSGAGWEPRRERPYPAGEPDRRGAAPSRRDRVQDERRDRVQDERRDRVQDERRDRVQDERRDRVQDERRDRVQDERRDRVQDERRFQSPPPAGANDRRLQAPRPVPHEERSPQLRGQSRKATEQPQRPQREWPQPSEENDMRRERERQDFGRPAER